MQSSRALHFKRPLKLIQLIELPQRKSLQRIFLPDNDFMCRAVESCVI